MKGIYVCVGILLLFFGFAPSTFAASFSFAPLNKNVNVGEIITVQILLDTQGESIDGVDIKSIEYNPYYFELQDADSSKVGTQIQAGILMPNTVANSADTVNGKISFSQVTNGGSTYTGSGVLATLTFKALVAGSSTLKLTFTPNVTTDTNVAHGGTDVLRSVSVGQYTIGNAQQSDSSIKVGSRIQTNANTNVRKTPSISGVKLGTQKALSLGTVVGGPALANGYTWWNINFDTGVDGYSVSDFLNAISNQVTEKIPSGQITTRLALGSTGEQVLLLQKFLTSEGLLSSTNQSGYFGTITESAVKAFQKKYGIVSSGTPATTGYGIVGPSTRVKINVLIK